MHRSSAVWLAASVLVVAAGVADAQLVAVDDVYGVPVLQQLVVEAPGVLNNDLYDEEPAEDGGATAVLVDGPLYGTLECESNPTFELCPDGSFLYTPSVDYPGSDEFSYRAVVEPDEVQATVTLSACDGGPTLFICWSESEFLARLGTLGYESLSEGFEDDLAWGSARSPYSAHR